MKDIISWAIGLAATILVGVAVAGQAHAENNWRGRDAVQATGVKARTQFGCSTAEVVKDVLDQPNAEAGQARLQMYDSIGVCIDFERAIPIRAMAPVLDAPNAWGGPAVIWLMRYEWPDGTSSDFYWAFGEAMSNHLKRTLGIIGVGSGRQGT